MVCDLVVGRFWAPKKPGNLFTSEKRSQAGRGWCSTLSYQKKVVVVMSDPIYAGMVIAPNLSAPILSAQASSWCSHNPHGE